MLSLSPVQTYYVPPSQLKIWRKIPNIGGVLTLETLTFRMYGLISNYLMDLITIGVQIGWVVYTHLEAVKQKEKDADCATVQTFYLWHFDYSLQAKLECSNSNLS